MRHIGGIQIEHRSHPRGRVWHLASHTTNTIQDNGNPATAWWNHKKKKTEQKRQNVRAEMVQNWGGSTRFGR
jgi:hypothetical protein